MDKDVEMNAMTNINADPMQPYGENVTMDSIDRREHHAIAVAVADYWRERNRIDCALVQRKAEIAADFRRQRAEHVNKLMERRSVAA